MGEGVHGSAPGPSPEEPRSAADDDGGMYGVFGEGKPRHIVGDSDEPPHRRPRKKVHDGRAWLGRPVEG